MIVFESLCFVCFIFSSLLLHRLNYFYILCSLFLCFIGLAFSFFYLPHTTGVGGGKVSK